VQNDSYIVDKGYAELEADPALESHLGALAFRGLAKRPLFKLMVDLSRDRKELSSGMVLAVALALAERWRGRFEGDRVGVVFPAGLGGLLTNLALSFLDKVPVNFNFTAGRSALEHALHMSGVRTVITAAPVKEKVGDFPWPDDTVDLLRERAHLPKKVILRHFLKVALLPNGWLLRHYRIPTRGGRREAGLLFSSGSTGNPKGIPLTHRNVIANCLQVRHCELLNHSQTMLAYLPIFHSFGFTVTMWYPLLMGVRCVLMPSPLETRKIAEAVEAEKVTVMIGTPTFLRPYFSRATPQQLASLRFVVAGAEKTPPGFGERWEQQFGSEYLEGYGLTETSPVASVNLPARPEKAAIKRSGSVGQPMWGMQLRVVDPQSGKVLARNQRGMLQLRGANVFEGYLDDAQATAAAFDGDWFVTGDLGRIDEDGYLFIEGRVSRFSKLGGEMVPHGRVEQEIAKAFGLDEAESPLVAVTGVDDEQKGEALVVLTAVELDSAVIRERLMKAGLPVLWIPRVVLRVDHIPCLASGKLDLQGLQQMAVSALARR
jgi:acyl-[acyl-carrier-protein]-phospholipid O-acyltransferase/long-chain-fatty-acid--[acyl-carrier-protein] ligase